MFISLPNRLIDCSKKLFDKDCLFLRFTKSCYSWGRKIKLKAFLHQGIWIFSIGTKNWVLNSPKRLFIVSWERLSIFRTGLRETLDVSIEFLHLNVDIVLLYNLNRFPVNFQSLWRFIYGLILRNIQSPFYCEKVSSLSRRYHPWQDESGRVFRINVHQVFLVSITT